MKHHKKTIVSSIVILSILVAMWICWTMYKSYSSTEIIVVNETSNEEISFGDSKKLEEIREREDVKRQQELIVQEIYLTEEKERIEDEKEKAIEDFDSQITDVEDKLESVREEKLSF